MKTNVSRECTHTYETVAFFHLLEHKSTWANSHAQMPTPMLIDNYIRIFFTTRDQYNISRISSIDLDYFTFAIVRGMDSIPALDVGINGRFDSEGVMTSCIVAHGRELMLYYIGWANHPMYPYQLAVGAALSSDSGRTFVRISNDAIYDSDDEGALFVTTPYVVVQDSKWLMYYSRGNQWQFIDGRYESSYNLRIANSIDGLTWVSTKSDLPHQNNGLKSQARPVVCVSKERPHIYFSNRNNIDFRGGAGHYKIEVLRKDQSENWVPCKVNFISNTLFEQNCSEMQSYAMPFSTSRGEYIVFNGNKFGRHGFAIAKEI